MHYTPGDRVIHREADDPRAIPAMRVMFGTVIAPATLGRVRVAWDCNGKRLAEDMFPAQIRPITPEEEDERRRTTTFG